MGEIVRSKYVDGSGCFTVQELDDNIVVKQATPITAKMAERKPAS
jgi:hypothetical protein